MRVQGARELLPFQKALTVVDPFTSRLMVVPTTWPDTASDSFISNQAIIEARRHMTRGDDRAPVQFRASVTATLNQLLRRHNLPASMQIFDSPPPEAIHVLGSANGFGPRAVQELQQRGYRGAILPESIRTTPAFSDWDILTSGLASLILHLPGDLRAYIRETELTEVGVMPE